MIAVLVVAIVADLVLALIPAAIARSKARSFAGWYLASALLGVILTTVLALVLPTARCSYCRQPVHPEATRCQHCHSLLAPVTADPAQRLADRVAVWAAVLVVPLAVGGYFAAYYWG